MEFIACRVAIKFLQPPLASVCRRGAVFAALMPMPKTAVDEDSDAMFRQNNVGPDKANKEGRN